LTWLTDVLERIVSGRTKNHQLHELLRNHPPSTTALALRPNRATV
jgi:hypothetical protein